jgi:DNA polymerase (family 10)
MKNQFVADVLYQIADLLDLKGEIFFKTRAYRMAAQTIEVLDEDIEDIVKKGKLRNISGIGEALAKKITELVETGKLEYFEQLKKEIPAGLLEMLEISGLGPKKVAALYQKLNIKTIEELRKACIDGKVRSLEGFGEITERNILRGIQLKEKTSGRVLLNVAFEDGKNYTDFLKKCKEIKRLSIAGSLRRWKETIGDLDILASSDSPDEVMDYFVKYNDVQRVLLKGSTKTSVILNDNLQVDLRVVKDKSYGAALQYFTGSKEHNVKMRSIAIKQGFKLNEYGLFNKENEKFIVGKNEEEIYKKLGLFFIEPELRENRGEIEAAIADKLPNLVQYEDIKGDFHIHSNWSDGFEPIENLAKHAKKIGNEYIGIADHSQSLRVAQGLSEVKVKKKIEEIEKINKNQSNFRVLCGTECDIKADGSLDYSDMVLKMFDYVGIGIHTNFKMSPKEITNRILKGMENENVTFLAHPTCRIIGRREPFELDIEKIIDKAVETKTYLEINAFPDRLDLNDLHAKIAKEKNVKFIIGTDAHNINHLGFMQFGVATARRAWLEKKDILNTYSLKEVEKKLGL